MNLKLTNLKKDKLGRLEAEKSMYIYIIKCFSDVESFIKLGYTSHKDLNKRFNDEFPYKFNILYIKKVKNT